MRTIQDTVQGAMPDKSQGQSSTAQGNILDTARGLSQTQSTKPSLTCPVDYPGTVPAVQLI